MCESSEKGCCCSQCPPWWVTMGFVPPLQGTQAKTPAATTQAGTTQATPTQGSSGSSSSSSGLGGILGDVLSLL